MKLKIFLFFLCNSVFITAYAQWRADTINGGKMVVRQTRHSDRFFTIADNAGGTINLFVQLVNNQNGGADYAIKMQRCDSNATLRAGTVDSGLTIQPVINELFDGVTDGSGGAYILYALWSPETHAEDSVYLYLQHINNNGQKLWGDFGRLVSRQETNFDFRGKLLLYNDNTVAVVFTVAEYGDNGYGQLFAQKYTTAGIALWAAGGVAVCTAVERRGAFYLTHDGSGGLLVVFEDGRNGTFTGSSYDNLDIYMQHITAAGALANGTAGVAVINTASLQHLYEEKPGDKYVYPDGTGGCYFLYRTEDLNNGDINDIYVQRMNAAGQVLWTNQGTLVVRSDYSGRSVYAIDMVVAPAGGLSVLYNTSVGSGYYNDPTELRLQNISTTGMPQYAAGAGKKIATAFNTGYQEYAGPFDITYTSQGEALVAFNSKDDSIHLRLQKIKTDGTLTWDSAGTTLIRQAAYLPQWINSGNGNYLLRWFDRRNYIESFNDGDADFFISKLTGTGVLISSRTTIVSAANGVWNNPATWTGGVVPGPNDIVVITKAVTVTATASCYSLSVEQPAGNLTIQNGVSLTVRR